MRECQHPPLFIIKIMNAKNDSGLPDVLPGGDQSSVPLFQSPFSSRLKFWAEAISAGTLTSEEDAGS